MLLYRIAPATHAADLTGEGARIYGGRWNPVGTPVIYTSESVALAMLEVLAHMPHHLIATIDLRKVVIEVPDSATIRSIRTADLPAGWNRHPAPGLLVQLGSQWSTDRNELLLKVPNAVTSGDGYNILINPMHPDSNTLHVVSNTSFPFDPRILATGIFTA